MSKKSILAQINKYGEALAAGDLTAASKFWATNADTVTSGGTVRGRAKIKKALEESIEGQGDQLVDRVRLSGSASGEIANVRMITDSVGIVDAVIDAEETSVTFSFDSGGALVSAVSEKPMNWTTELWAKGSRGFELVASRPRVGDAGARVKQLESGRFQVSRGSLDASTAKRHTTELRKSFKRFRAAWNAGDSSSIRSLLDPKADAIATFGFLGGRSQILADRTAVVAKADRMAGSTIVRGDPASVQFVTSDVALVEGTVFMTGIPKAHGIAPKEMSGTYTDVWVQDGQAWNIAATRPFF